MSGLASLCVALLAPIVGAIADRSSSRVRLLLMVTVLGAAGTAGLALVGQGHWLAASALYLAASLGFWGGIVFNDSLLLHVAEPDEYDLVSGFGYSLGYLGGGLLFAVNVLMTQKPALFGLQDAGEAVRASFVMAGVWWLLFALPCVLLVKETRRWQGPRRGGPGRTAGAVGTRSHRSANCATTGHRAVSRRVRPLHRRREYRHQDGGRLRHVARHRPGRVDQGAAAHPVRGVSGGPGVRLAGRVASARFPAFSSPWPSTCLATCYAYFIDSAADFYGLAVDGRAGAGRRAVAEPLYFGRLVPAGKSSEFFGFYNMMGKFAAVIGPVLVGVTAAATGDQRLSILSVALLFLGAAACSSWRCAASDGRERPRQR